MPEIGVELAHDLRMPLQLIYASAQMLQAALDDPSIDAAHYLAMLMDSVRGAQRLLDGALESCGRAWRSDAPRPVRVDLPGFVRGLCLRCRPWADERGVRISCSGNTAALAMLLDEDMLSRILLNLISNALRFTPRGGHIRVRWRAMGDFAEVSVTDDGEGIPPERLPRVFLRGESDGGHGLGLPIARELARAMGGDLTARSRRAAGSVFTLRLPVRVNQPLAGAL